MAKDRHDRLAHELGNADGRQDLPPQGEMEHERDDVAEVPANVDTPFEFLPMSPAEIAVQAHRGPAHGGHVELNPESMDAHRGDDVESTHEEVLDLPWESSMDVGVVEDSDLKELFAVLMRRESRSTGC